MMFIGRSEGRKNKNKAGGGRAVGIFFVAMFFLAGVMFGLCLCRAAELFLLHKAKERALLYAESVADRPASFTEAKELDAYKELASLNPFRADDRELKAEKKESETPPDFVLVGTLPGVAAWINDGETTRLILRNQEMAGYRLSAVTSGRALISKDGESTPLYLEFARGANKKAPPPPPVAKRGGQPRPPKPSEPADSFATGIQPATPDSEGVVPRELVEKLLMDPYEEIAKMRMIPAEGGGMRLERISPDSVLGSVGVKQGDVVTALNGIDISNLGDVANAVNSMMAGTRFDVTVQRDGKPVSLKYQVQ